MRELLEKAKEMALHLVSTVIDCTFLLLWTLPNLKIESVIEHAHISGIDLFIYRCMQFLFGLVTLAPICIWLRRDFTIMSIRADSKIAHERELSKRRNTRGKRDEGN